MVVRNSQVLRAEQPEDRLRGDRGHVAALLIEPLGIAFLGQAITDKGQARRAQCD